MADIKGITSALDNAFGCQGLVFHEIVSDQIHLDVLLYCPATERQTHVLVTCGMSALPMASPEGHDRYAELCIELPPSWPLTGEAFKDERNYWPIRLLKDLARFPHRYRSWLGFGHTIPNRNPAVPYADSTKLCCALLMPPKLLPKAIHRLPVPESAANPEGEESAQLLQVVPIHRCEMEHKLAHGLKSLLKRLGDSGVGPEIDPHRRDCCAPQ